MRYLCLVANNSSAFIRVDRGALCLKVFEIKKLLLHGKAPSMGLAISVLLRLTAPSGRRLKKSRAGVF